jgi:hypothetical protein
VFLEYLDLPEDLEPLDYLNLEDLVFLDFLEDLEILEIHHPEDLELPDLLDHQFSKKI